MRSKKLVTNETILLSIEQIREAIAAAEIPLTYEQFAAKFGYEVSTVRKKVSRGEIPVRKRKGSRPVIFLSDLNAQTKGVQ